MAVDPTLLQMQLRRNNEDMAEMLQGLSNWEEEIKKRDKLLKKQKPILKKNLPPIRGKKGGAPKEKKAEKKQERIKSFDYNAWSKYDVDKECDNVDDEDEEESEEEEGDEDEEISRRETAILEKDRGNQLYKEGKYEAAIERYTAGISLDPTSAVLPANRAMALIKLERFAAAVRDCDLSIALDDKYTKAWMRRATAKGKLQKYKSAIEDLEMVLKLEPTNKHAKSELQKLQKFKDSEVTDDRRHVKPVKRPPHLRSKEPLVRIEIEEISTTSSKDLLRHEEEEEEERTELNDVKNDDTQSFEVPTSSIQFQCQWKSLKSDHTKLVQYFKVIPPSQYPLVLKQSLDTDTFTDIIDILYKDYIEKGISCLDELEWITKVERFSVSILFLNKKDKQRLRDIFDGLLTLCERTRIIELAKQFSLSI